MNRLVLLFMLIFGFTTISYSQSGNAKGELIVKIIGFKNDKGQVCVSLFNNPKGFPGKYENAYKTMRSPIKGNQATITFTDLSFGTYALSVLHDENANNKLDTNFIGMPKEGCGASNNPKPFMGPPSFSDAKFDLNSIQKTVEISIKYL